jgi:hypothetical protein
MRTTVDLPNELTREVKIAAASRGVTLKVFLRMAVEHELKRESVPLKPEKLKFPLVSSKKPGALKISNEQIEDLLA